MFLAFEKAAYIFYVQTIEKRPPGAPNRPSDYYYIKNPYNGRYGRWLVAFVCFRKNSILKRNGSVKGSSIKSEFHRPDRPEWMDYCSYASILGWQSRIRHKRIASTGHNLTGMGNRPGHFQGGLGTHKCIMKGRGIGGNYSARPVHNVPVGVPFCDDFYSPDFDHFDYYRNVFLSEPSVI